MSSWEFHVKKENVSLYTQWVILNSKNECLRKMMIWAKIIRLKDDVDTLQYLSSTVKGTEPGSGKLSKKKDAWSIQKHWISYETWSHLHLLNCCVQFFFTGFSGLNHHSLAWPCLNVYFSHLDFFQCDWFEDQNNFTASPWKCIRMSTINDATLEEALARFR